MKKPNFEMTGILLLFFVILFASCNKEDYVLSQNEKSSLDWRTSNLTSLTYSEYQNLTITEFEFPADVTSTGSPDERIEIQLSGWVGTDVLAFTITTDPYANSSISIYGTEANTLNTNITSGSNPASQTTYWTVDMGEDASSSDWEISFRVEANSTNTGKWTFVKGKGT